MTVRSTLTRGEIRGALRSGVEAAGRAELAVYRGLVGRLVWPVTAAADPGRVMSAAVRGTSSGWKLDHWGQANRRRRELARGLLDDHVGLGTMDVLRFFPSIERQRGEIDADGVGEAIGEAEGDVVVVVAGFETGDGRPRRPELRGEGPHGQAELLTPTSDQAPVEDHALSL